VIEIIRPAAAPAARAALFDFDGTLSLIRTGWMRVMVPMMVEVLAELGTGESEDALRQVTEDFVWRLTGRETIYQMIELTRQVELRGGTPADPLAYKRCYLERLGHVIAGRLDALRDRRCPPDAYLVPGARALLEALRERGLHLYLASGTDESFVKEEADLLDVTRYFDGGIFGARDEGQAFSKRSVIEGILALPDVRGADLIGFGDGYVEIEEVKRVGGVAIGVATDEPECRVADEWKRQRLIGVGADYIVPNYVDWRELLAQATTPA
jgi:phosphoglycolate phosphatase